MAYTLKFGTYTLPAGFYPADDSSSRILAPSKLPRADGARILTGYKDAKRLVVRGGIIKGAIAPVQTAWATRMDALKAALDAGPANLYFGRNDRYYYNCQVESFGNPFGPTGFGRIASDMEIVFLSPSPFECADSASVDLWTPSGTGDTHAVVTAGNAYVESSISLTVGGSGAKTLAWTVTNNTTGESFTLTGAVTGGDVVVVDCLLKTVTISSVDKVSLFDGQFARMNVGSNTWTVTYGAATISQVSFSWRNRWW